MGERLMSPRKRLKTEFLQEQTDAFLVQDARMP